MAESSVSPARKMRKSQAGIHANRRITIATLIQEEEVQIANLEQ